MKVYDADGHLVRVISTEALQQRPDPFAGQQAPPVERATERSYFPSVSPVRRRQQASASPTRRNKGRARTAHGVVAA